MPSSSPFSTSIDARAPRLSLISGPGIEPFTSLRHGPWKLLVFHDGPRVELYDVSGDISEERDLALDRPDVVEAMLAYLKRIAVGTGLQMSIDKSTGAPVAIPEAAQPAQG